MKERNWLQKLGDAMPVGVQNLGLKVKKNEPKLWLIGGCTGFFVTMMLVHKAALHADEVLDRHEERMEKIDQAAELDEEYVESGAKKQDVAVAYLKMAGDYGKLYAPVIGAGVLTLGCFLTSYKVLNKRYMGAVAYGEGLAAMFKQYRENVRKDGGEELDRHYLYGTKKEMVTKEIVDEKGKKKKVQEEVESMDPNAKRMIYMRYVDASNKLMWDPNPDVVLMQLTSVQNVMNNILQNRKKLLLNEVLDALGFEMTPEGGIVGWVIGNGDDYVDFGLTDMSNPAVRDFINRKTNEVPLVFNCDGPVLHLF